MKTGTIQFQDPNFRAVTPRSANDYITLAEYRAKKERDGQLQWYRDLLESLEKGTPGDIEDAKAAVRGAIALLTRT